MRSVSTIILLLCISASLSAEDFTTQTAKAAQKAYQEDLKTARDNYAAALNEAAKKAVEVGELDEVIRIKKEKDRLSGVAVKEATTKPKIERTLWIKDSNVGFFERLNTKRHWIERVNNDQALLYNESARTDEYVELSLTGTERIIRLYKEEFIMRNKRKEPLKRIRGGHWER